MHRSIRLAAWLALAAPAFAQTTRISVDASGAEGNNESGRASFAFDGRTFAFVSRASNLVPQDNNGQPDIFVKDLVTGAVVRASVSSGGDEANSFSLSPVIAADGRFVAFYSHASNLVPGDTNGAGDIFVRDLAQRRTEIVSISSAGALGNFTSRGAAISADGRFVAYASGADNLVPGDTNSIGDIFVRDRLLATTVRISVDSAGLECDGFSNAPMMSADGRYVVFASEASNLVPGDNNGKFDVFVHDAATGAMERASVSSTGAEGDGPSGYIHVSGYYFAAISADGRFVAFESYATNLVPGDTNGAADIFLRDRVNGTTVRASVASDGAESNDLSIFPCVWGNGRFVAFESSASNLAVNDVNGNDDIFVHDFATGATTLLSVDSQGVRGDSMSSYPIVSGDESVLAFDSYSTNLVAQDTNACVDLFLRPLPQIAPPSSYCSSQTNSQGCVPQIAWAGTPSLSSTSGFVIRADDSLNQTPGLLLYGLGSASVPLLGGTLCVASPLARSGGLGSGGNALPTHDCSGVLAIDFDAMVQSASPPWLTLGSEVFAQFWSRDVPAPAHAHLTNGVRFTLEP